MRARNRGTNTPTQVRFVRGGSRRHTAGPVQEWKSDLTGRSYEIFEINSYEQTERLGVGSTGYLQYRDGTAYVTRSVNDPTPEPVRAPSTYNPVNLPRTSSSLPKRWHWTRWGLPVALVGFVLWQLARL